MSTDVLSALDRTIELSQRLSSTIAEDLERRGLTVAQAAILFFLHQVGPMVQRELSDLLGHTPRHVTSLVDRLEEAGFVRRSVHPADRRAWLVTLTDRGAVTADEMQAGRLEAARLLFGAVPPCELATYLAVLDGVLGRLEGVVETVSPPPSPAARQKPTPRP